MLHIPSIDGLLSCYRSDSMLDDTFYIFKGFSAAINGWNNCDKNWLIVN